MTFTAAMLGMNETEAGAARKVRLCELPNGGHRDAGPSHCHDIAQVRDLWQHRDMGPFKSSGYTATVEVHDVVVIRVSSTAE